MTRIGQARWRGSEQGPCHGQTRPCVTLLPGEARAVRRPGHAMSTGTVPIRPSATADATAPRHLRPSPPTPPASSTFRRSPLASASSTRSPLRRDAHGQPTGGDPVRGLGLHHRRVDRSGAAPAALRPYWGLLRGSTPFSRRCLSADVPPRAAREWGPLPREVPRAPPARAPRGGPCGTGVANSRCDGLSVPQEMLCCCLDPV